MYTGRDTIEWMYGKQFKAGGEWSVRTDNGFRWWPTDRAQTVEVVGEADGPSGERGYYISVRTELFKVRSLDGDALKQVEDMVQYIKDSVDEPDALPLATITRYAHDLALFARELHRVCKPESEVVTVIGNSTLRGNYIQNDSLVRKAYEHSGFRVVARAERELPENRRYLPVRTVNRESSMAKRMRTEVVLTVERP